MKHEPAKGDKVWVWHLGKLQQIEVHDTFTMVGGVLCVTFPGYASPDFHATRQEAVEALLGKIVRAAADAADITIDNADENDRFQHLLSLCSVARGEIGNEEIEE